MGTCTKTGWNTCGLVSNMKQIITLGSQVISLIYNIRAEGQDQTLMAVSLCLNISGDHSGSFTIYLSMNS